MDEESLSFKSGENPLKSDSPEVWDRLIEAAGPASIFLVIKSRMGAQLKRRLTPEDIWQEALIQAWRDRNHFEWRGVKSFRRWLLKIAENRIRDAADREGAVKRGGGVPVASLDGSPEDSEAPFGGTPIASTTPSRIAIYNEQSEAMHAALESLPSEQREVVRLRIFEELTMDEVASRLNLSFDAARHRFRKGAFQYERRLSLELASRSTGRAGEQV